MKNACNTTKSIEKMGSTVRIYMNVTIASPGTVNRMEVCSTDIV